MQHTRKHKVIMLLTLAIAIASLSVGFAAFSTTLNISSSASVNPNSDSFKVKFSTNQSSLVVSAVPPSSNSNGLIASSGVINDTISPTLSNLSVTFTAPEQYVEYTVYARNEGEYNAYLNSVNFLGEKTCTAIGDASQSLVESACNSINTVVYVGTTEYRETTEVSNHLLEKNTSEMIRIRLEYASNATSVDGNFRITFNDIMLVYSTINDSSYMPNYGSTNIKETLNTKIKENTLFKGTDAKVDFSATPETGIYVINGTENNENPIYYYRGEITNNNVLFAHFCWKIVRTTDTGGVKLIYNGTPTSTNQCNGSSTTIGNSKYNDKYTSIDAVHYLYEDGTNSTIKQSVDTWYSAKMTNYTDLLEDAVWCNDHSISSTNSGTTYFGPYARNKQTIHPSLNCPSEYSLTTSATTISNKLTYPVALLTADELTLAGMGWSGFSSKGYLNNYDYWWTMSPHYNAYSRTIMFFGAGHGGIDSDNANYVAGVRPAISLKAGTTVTSGDGTSSKPYIIE